MPSSLGMPKLPRRMHWEFKVLDSPFHGRQMFQLKIVKKWGIIFREEIESEWQIVPQGVPEEDVDTFVYMHAELLALQLPQKISSDGFVK